MKRALLFGLALFCTVAGFGQNPAPQTNWVAQALYAQPSWYLNFNDYNTSFKELITGVAFTAPATQSLTRTAGTSPFVTMASATPAGVAIFPSTGFAQAVTLQTVSVQFYAAPTAQALTICIANRSSNTFTITSTFTVNVTATTGVQTFTAGVDFSSGIAVAAGQYVGFYGGSGTTLPGRGAASSGNEYSFTSATVPSGTNTYTNFSYGPNISATGIQTITNGTTLFRQQGFDTTIPNNTSAGIPYNGYIQSPNNTIANFEWTQPFTVDMVIDRLTWARSTGKYLIAKGNVAGGGSYWDIYLTVDSNSHAQFCFQMFGAASGQNTQPTVCTANTGIFELPNGPNYDIVAYSAGTGGPANADIGIYVNGISGAGASGSVHTNAYKWGFGGVNLTLAGSGTGYANSTAFTSTGGGTNCFVTGTMISSGGVPASISNTTFSTNYGCTSAPTIVFTAPTGTGETITATPWGFSLSSPSNPLCIGGEGSGTACIGSNTTVEANLNVDEVAIFPFVLSQTQIQSLFAFTKFHQLYLAPNATPPAVLWSDDTSDQDNAYSLDLVIRAHLNGYVKLVGVEDTDGNGLSIAAYRQMLDQAGLSNIPVTTPNTTVTNNANTSTTALNTYNSATPQTVASYPNSVALYRRLFAQYSTSCTPLFVQVTGAFTGLSEFMQSTADGISSLTGAQLLAAEAACGGAIYAQGLNANSAFSSDNTLIDWTAGQYVVNNNCGSGGCSSAGAMPIYWFGGNPQYTGPGTSSTRTAKDPLYGINAHYGTDARAAFDSLVTAQFFSNFLSRGVAIAVGGSGTGYAAQTAFTSTGGGPNCVVAGYMNASGGVPSTISYDTPANTIQVGYGIGYGCTSAPTIVLTAPTGTGVTLTATNTFSCGTVTITSATSGSTSTSTCSQQYFVPLSINTVPSYTPFTTWIMNSLNNPSQNGQPRVQ